MHNFFKLVGAASVITLLGGFSTSSVTFPNVNINANDQGATLEIPAKMTRPDGAGPFPAIVLLHACGGASSSNVSRLWPSFFASLGYVTIAPNSLTPRNMQNCFSRTSALRYPNPIIGINNRIELERDAYGALEYLGQQSFVDENRVAMMGFSIGGMTIGTILHRESLSRAPGFVRGTTSTPSGLDFKAAISFYAPCSISGTPRTGPASLLPLDGRPRMPWLVVNGSNERKHYVSSCRAVAERHPDQLEFQVLQGIYHAFDVAQFTSIRRDPAGNEMLFSRQATETAQEFVEDFLARRMPD